ncbi:hypothetical protein SFRURICE_005362 [Spodoptera frugiperda]|nr:hypothetical protein SFRURICE_005362 [Spodoptera frugiperda]
MVCNQLRLRKLIPCTRPGTPSWAYYYLAQNTQKAKRLTRRRRYYEIELYISSQESSTSSNSRPHGAPQRPEIRRIRRLLPPIPQHPPCYLPHRQVRREVTNMPLPSRWSPRDPTLPPPARRRILPVPVKTSNDLWHVPRLRRPVAPLPVGTRPRYYQDINIPIPPRRIPVSREAAHRTHRRIIPPVPPRRRLLPSPIITRPRLDRQGTAGVRAPVMVSRPRNEDLLPVPRPYPVSLPRPYPVSPATKYKHNIRLLSTKRRSVPAPTPLTPQLQLSETRSLSRQPPVICLPSSSQGRQPPATHLRTRSLSRQPPVICLPQSAHSSQPPATNLPTYSHSRQPPATNLPAMSHIRQPPPILCNLPSTIHSRQPPVIQLPSSTTSTPSTVPLVSPLDETEAQSNWPSQHPPCEKSDEASGLTLPVLEDADEWEKNLRGLKKAREKMTMDSLKVPPTCSKWASPAWAEGLSPSPDESFQESVNEEGQESVIASKPCSYEELKADSVITFSTKNEIHVITIPDQDNDEHLPIRFAIPVRPRSLPRRMLASCFRAFESCFTRVRMWGRSLCRSESYDRYACTN